MCGSYTVDIGGLFVSQLIQFCKQLVDVRSVERRPPLMDVGLLAMRDEVASKINYEGLLGLMGDRGRTILEGIHDVDREEYQLEISPRPAKVWAWRRTRRRALEQRDVERDW